uniref:Integrase, catalytic region, zinc finger, CCHC-type, peptidase aspartic, catalytic n=1 Tax=Tanacetum cinerariifolium TaxID=118510 RepID=A0A699HKN2_TANCI|nr:hypothetical protein [Tanacetum cinerariifolium]
MNYLLQAISNEIYNSVDAYKNAKEMSERIKRLMHGSEITTHIRHSCLMNEFDKFASKERESLDSVYERLTTLVNIMDCNNVPPISVAINTKFLNCLQPKWSKYVTMDKKAAKNYDPLALIAHSNASSSQSHANSSYSPQAYYVTHPSSIVDYDDEYQGDKLTNAMIEQMLLAMKDEARINPGNKEKDFMLDNSYGEELEELTAAVMLTAQLQPVDNNAENVPSYDAKALAKKDFKEREDRYLNDILDLEEKLSSRHRIVYKMGQSIQMIHMLGKKPNKVYEPFLHAGLGYPNLKRLKKAIAAQPKMYDGDLLYSNNLVVCLHSHEKCVARHALFRKSSVKRALFTFLVAAKSNDLGVAFVVAKSRLSIVKTLTSTNKVSNASPLSQNLSQRRILSNYVNNKLNKQKMAKVCGD